MTTRSQAPGLDVRAWLVWGMAMTIPLLTGRHPIVLAELIVIVMVVRTVCLPAAQVRGWSWMVRLGMIAIPIGVLFNILTVHAGDQRIVRVNDDVPIIGGNVTWNALVYGLISGVTIVALVAVGTTVATALDWSSLMRLLPARAANVAVAGSVAWAFLPQLARSWQEIREAQAARGHRWRGARDVVPLVVPLMAGSLDRSITMAEALESRGFGSTANQTRSLSRSTILVAMALTLAVVGLYLFAVGQATIATAVLLGTAVLATLAVRLGEPFAQHRTTRYRASVWTRHDTVVVTSAMLAMGATAVFLQVQPEALRYAPYPSMDWPVTNPLLIAALGLLMLPAVVAPATVGDSEAEEEW